MNIDPERNNNQNSNSKREQNILPKNHSSKTNKPNAREYGLLDDKIILPEDFAELDLEIEKLFYGEDYNQSFNCLLPSNHLYSVNILTCL